ncbi:hypothetical protein SAMN02745746_03788 [Pseudogulbenkiania subflava DSM 22618]|uniref:Uncharacterized protein n=1 Tax=Pseudogulbenkiania subflava DSM 22618 TaxID=1123014 RepID=A0A1Y6C9J8_9NEIS|nr:hypothetical protein SAMN02745746_03788 [Pseudogulbenkiania subflava DSM 22618]
MALLCLPALPLAAVSAPTIRLASDNWCPYICTQDSAITGGVLVELTGQIVSSVGYRLESLLMSRHWQKQPESTATDSHQQRWNGQDQGIGPARPPARKRPSRSIALSPARLATHVRNTAQVAHVARIKKRDASIGSAPSCEVIAPLMFSGGLDAHDREALPLRCPCHLEAGGSQRDLQRARHRDYSKHHPHCTIARR